jgi:sugar phosphate isomerase/epimerase
MQDFIREKICLYSGLLPGHNSAFKIADHAVQLGARGIELMSFCEDFRTPDKRAAREVFAYVKRNALEVPCFTAAASLVGEKRGESIERLKLYAEICAEHEVPYLHHTVAPSLTPPACEEAFEQVFKEGIEAALEVSDYARRLGVQTIVENQGYIFNGVESFNRFIDETRGEIGALLDFGNMMFTDDTCEGFISGFKHGFVHAHIKDFAIEDTIMPDTHPYKTLGGKYLYGCETGYGSIDFAASVRALREKGYDGSFSLEPNAISDEAIIERTLRFIYNTFGNQF